MTTITGRTKMSHPEMRRWPISRSAQRIRMALLARAYGAGDIKVALIVGEYPPCL